MIEFLKRFYARPFETCVGIYVIVNGILTLTPGYPTKDALYSLIGAYALAIPVFQILAGTAKLSGLILSKSNLEAAGLILVMVLFAIRGLAISFVEPMTGINFNSMLISALIVIANLTRLAQIFYGKKTVFYTG